MLYGHTKCSNNAASGAFGNRERFSSLVIPILPPATGQSIPVRLLLGVGITRSLCEERLTS